MLVTRTVLAASMTVAFTFAGSAHAEKQFIIDIPEQTVAAGSTGGSWFITSTALFDLYNDNIEGLRYNIVPGGGVSNPISVHRGDAAIAMGYTTNLYSAYNGAAPYEEEFKDLRAVANINVASVLHPFILSDIPINSLKELGDKRYGISIDTGTRGTGGELAGSRTLAAHGASYDNIRDWGGSVTHSGYSEAMDRLKDGHIEAFMNDDIIRTPSFVDLTLARDVKLLPLDPSTIEELASNYGYTPSSIPSGSYKNQDSDIPTIAQHHVIFAHKDTSEELVYAMVKLMFENKEHLVQAHPLFENLDLAEGPKNFPIPLHSGAERFYREAGVLD